MDAQPNRDSRDSQGRHPGSTEMDGKPATGFTGISAQDFWMLSADFSFYLRMRQ